MDDEKIIELVELIQKKIKGIPTEQIYRNITYNCEDEFMQLYDALERYGKCIISNFIITRQVHQYMNKEDTWQNFVVRRLCIAIQKFNKTKKTQFKTYLYKTLIHQCKDDLRKTKGMPELVDVEKIDFSSEIINEISDSNENKRAWIKFFKGYFKILNDLKSKVKKILVYHCKIFLSKAMRLKEYSLLNKWQ